MTGTPSQVEWAVLIKQRVGDEFDRVAHAFSTVALTQSADDRADTEAILRILKERRDEVMATDRAGYFISAWQELNGKVRETLAADPRYQAIKTRRERRKREPEA